MGLKRWRWPYGCVLLASCPGTSENEPRCAELCHALQSCRLLPSVRGVQSQKGAAPLRRRESV
jgi:hypothetical protein